MIACLKRKNLLFNPNNEPGIYLDRSILKKWFDSVINRWVPNKLHLITLLYGDKNAGKTHFLKYINWNLLQSNIPMVEYIDLQKLSNEYEFYLRIIEALIRCGFIENFINEISKLHYDPERIMLWIQGNLEKIKDLWIEDIKKDSFYSRVILSELLRAFYNMHNRTYPYLLLDHLESIVGDPPKNYMSKKGKEESIKHLRTIIDHSCIIMAIEYNNIWDFKEYFPKFNMSIFDEFNFNNINSEDISELIKDLNTIVINYDKIKNLNIKRYNGEEISYEHYPLTKDCYDFIQTLRISQPGIILNLLNDALKKSLEVTGDEIITKNILEQSIQNLFPISMAICKSCKVPLNQINIHILTRNKGLSEILEIKCPLCGASVTDIVPLVLSRIIPDTSALVDKSISALFDRFRELGVRNQVNIYIPEAVRREIAAWEKRSDKYSASRSALYELNNIRKLARRKYVRIEQNVGRVPTEREIFLAQTSDSIDRIITETAEILDATLITGDNLLAENYSSSGYFSLYIIKEKRNNQLYEGKRIRYERRR